MGLIFLLSVVLKGIGALLEIGIQILITRSIGLDGYGTYSALISSADLLFWMLFSGIIKCNTFYLSEPNTCIRTFRRRYYGWYALPVLGAVAVGLMGSGSAAPVMIPVITALELLVLDRSSSLMAQGQPVLSLTGEYILGRTFLVLCLCAMHLTGTMHRDTLLWAYCIQYPVILCLFRLRGRRTQPADVSEQVSLRKWALFQRSDALHTLIGQVPVLLQYGFTGALEAGVVSILLLIRKLVGFISGPASKLFLPEFSRLHREGKPEQIRNSFASIMRIQMLFAGPLAVVLIGFPRVILRILAEELLSFETEFVLCALVFLLSATTGPCSGVMLMTGHEKEENRFREASMIAMLVVMVLMGRDRLFVLYGLCAHTILESGSKYCFVCRWMQKAPVSLTTYLGWWAFPVLVIAAARLLAVQESLPVMLLAAGSVFLFFLCWEYRQNPELLNKVRRK